MDDAITQIFCVKSITVYAEIFVVRFLWVISKSQKFTYLIINNLLCVLCKRKIFNDGAIKVL